jgi:Ca2+-binding RTX toxin-like protein
MASPSTSAIIQGLVNYGVAWSGDTITYSFPAIGSNWGSYFPSTGDYDYLNEPYRKDFSSFSAVQQQSFRDSLGQWAELIPVKFAETNDLLQPGDLRAAFTATLREYKAYAPPVKGSSGPVNGDIWIDSYYKDLTFKVGWDFEHGDFVTPMLLQAIGVALGLNTYDMTNKLNLPAEFDSTRYTIMSWNNPLIQTYTFGEYFDGSKNVLNTNGYAVVFSTPMVFDILALQSIYGVNTKTRAGADTYSWTENKAFFTTIFDGGGVDTIDLKSHGRASIIDLTPGAYSSIDLFTVEQQKAFWTQILPQYRQQIADELDRDARVGNLYTGANNLGIAYSTVIENVDAGSGDDVITGNNADNVLNGNGGADKISAGLGDDHLSGGAGDDVLDGGAGIDEARYSGKLADYAITPTATGWIVADGRTGTPDGRDTLTGVESLAFSDQTAKLANPGVAVAVHAILRTGAVSGTSGALALDLSTKIAAGLQTQAGAVVEIAKAAGAATSVATLSYEFFTGKIPGEGGVDYLVSPTGPNANNLNSAYYQSFNLENRYINFAVNLGKVGEGKDAFAAKYGNLSLFDATREAYKTIFGAAPTDAKIHALIDTRTDYFATYGGDGTSGIGTKAAMVGWLLAEAVKADVGVMAKSNDAWLADLADGSAPFAIDILDPAKGYWKADFIFGGG